MTVWCQLAGAWLHAKAAEDRGASLVEYVLMVSLIALVCVVAIGYFQDEVATSFSESASSIETAG